MVMNTFEDRPMTEQFTKYAKNVVFKDSYPSAKEIAASQLDSLKKSNQLNTNANSATANNSNITNNTTGFGSHLIKSASRGSSNMTGISNGPTSTIGTPLSLTNSNNLPKPVLISGFNTAKYNTNLSSNVNSANINSNLNSLRNENSLIKNDRIKSSSLARSVTMKYTKSHFENSNSLTGTAPNQQHLLSYGSSSNTANPNGVTNSNNMGMSNSNGGLNYPFTNQNRKAPSSSLQQQLAHNQKQQQLIIDLSNPKKEFYNALHRSTSINLGREKSSLSNYFSTLNSNLYLKKKRNRKKKNYSPGRSGIMLVDNFFSAGSYLQKQCRKPPYMKHFRRRKTFGEIFSLFFSQELNQVQNANFYML